MLEFCFAEKVDIIVIWRYCSGWLGKTEEVWFDGEEYRTRENTPTYRLWRFKVRLFLSMMMDKKDLSGESRVFFFTLSSTDDPSPLLRHATSRHPPLQIEVHLMLARILELMQVTLSSVTYYLAKDRGAAAGIACDKL